MREFAVTYRDQNGQRVTESVKAENREALFKVLKGRNIHALGIKEGASRPSASRGRSGARRVGWGPKALAALAFAGIVAALWMTFWREAAVPAPQVKPPAAKPAKKPVEVPAKAPKQKLVTPVAVPAPSEPPPQRVGETRDGYILLPSGRRHRVKGVVTNSTSVVKSKYAIFKHPSENILAGILMSKPGQGMVGTPHYNGKFTQNFLESLSEPIVVNDDDPDDVKELKRALTEVKKELKAAHDRGEDIEEIVLDARMECQELARYRHQLEVSIHEFAKKEEGITEKDIDDYVAAANEMLAQKGIAPLKLTTISRIKLKLKESEKEK